MFTLAIDKSSEVKLVKDYNNMIKNGIKILLIGILFIVYHKIDVLSNLVVMLISIMYVFTALFFGFKNYLDKKIKGYKIQIGKKSIYYPIEFVWFLIGSFVLVRNFDKFNNYILIMFFSLLVYILSYVKIISARTNL